MELIIDNILEIDIYSEDLLGIDGEVFGFIKELLLIFNKEFMEFILII